MKKSTATVFREIVFGVIAIVSTCILSMVCSADTYYDYSGSLTNGTTYTSYRHGDMTIISGDTLIYSQLDLTALGNAQKLISVHMYDMNVTGTMASFILDLKEANGLNIPDVKTFTFHGKEYSYAYQDVLDLSIEDFYNLSALVVCKQEITAEKMAMYDLYPDGKINCFDGLVYLILWNSVPYNHMQEVDSGNVTMEDYLSMVAEIGKYSDNFQINATPVEVKNYSFYVDSNGNIGQVTQNDNGTVNFYTETGCITISKELLSTFEFELFDSNGNSFSSLVYSTETETTTEITETTTSETTETTITETTTQETTETTTESTSTETTETTSPVIETGPNGETIPENILALLTEGADTFNISNYKIVYSDHIINYSLYVPDWIISSEWNLVVKSMQVCPIYDIWILDPNAIIEDELSEEAIYAMWDHIAWRPIQEEDGEEFQNDSLRDIMFMEEDWISYIPWYLVPLDSDGNEELFLRYPLS